MLQNHEPCRMVCNFLHALTKRAGFALKIIVHGFVIVAEEFRGTYKQGGLAPLGGRLCASSCKCRWPRSIRNFPRKLVCSSETNCSRLKFPISRVRPPMSPPVTMLCHDTVETKGIKLNPSHYPEVRMQGAIWSLDKILLPFFILLQQLFTCQIDLITGGIKRAQWLGTLDILHFARFNRRIFMPPHCQLQTGEQNWKMRFH